MYLPPLITADEVRSEVEALRVDRGLTHEALAAKADVSAGFIGMVLSGAREPSKAFLKAFGYERVTLYRRKVKR